MEKKKYRSVLGEGPEEDEMTGEIIGELAQSVIDDMSPDDLKAFAKHNIERGLKMMEITEVVEQLEEHWSECPILSKLRKETKEAAR